MHIRIFRHLAVIFCVLLPSPILSLAQDDQNEQSDTSVPVHETLELAFTSAELPENPFDTYLLRLELTDPAGRSFEMDGFYDGDGDGGQDGNVWKARITPDAPGEWAWRTIPGDDGVVDPEMEGLSGSFEATPSDHNGPIVAEGRHFRYKDGDYVYLIGNFLDFRNGLRSTHTFTSETTTDEMRDAIFEAQVDFHGVNKVNLYLANKDDYSSQSVTPWVGTAEDNDKTQMDLARWALYDEYVRRFGERDIVTEMWFLADDSDFGSLSSAEIERLLRYGMARLSAFSYTMFVFSLEWQEAFSADEVREYGAYLAAHNPWERLISVHTLELTPWEFTDDDWVTFIASQAGNETLPPRASEYNIDMTFSDDIPHLSEEFGILNEDTDPRLRANLWNAFLGGAAGSGTGSDLKALSRFIEVSEIPFAYMVPDNSLAQGGGDTRFVLNYPDHHYAVYSMDGSFDLTVSGEDLTGQWFNPRDENSDLSEPFAVEAGTSTFTPPEAVDQDWVLWITDSSQPTAVAQRVERGLFQGDLALPLLIAAGGGIVLIGLVVYLVSRRRRKGTAAA